MSAQDSDGDLSFSNKQEGRLSEDHICPINAHSNAKKKKRLQLQGTIHMEMSRYKKLLPLTVRCTLEIANFQSCPLTERKRRFTVHSTDVEASIVYFHWIQNQFWRITIGNLNHTRTKKYFDLVSFKLN